MRAEQPHKSTMGKGEEDRRKQRRTRRREATGPIGFGQVFAGVKKHAARGTAGAGARTNRGAMSSGETRQSDTKKTDGGFPALQIAPALTLVNKTANTAATPLAPGLEINSAATTAGNLAEILHGESTGTAKMTPDEAMQSTFDLARDLNRMSDMRELVLELNPDHLGRLVVQMRVERGRIRADLRTETPEANEALGRHADQLKSSLLGLGYASADVSVTHDESLSVTPRSLDHSSVKVVPFKEKSI